MLQAQAELVGSDALVESFAATLGAVGLHRALGYLNEATPYRFTGVYRFAPGWVRSHALFDRFHPTFEVRAHLRMNDAHGMFTAHAGEALVMENDPEPHWVGHAARTSALSYAAVLLSDPSGAPLGTLCHFDFCSQALPPGELDRLAAVRGPVQEYLWTQGAVAHPDTRLS